METLSYLIIRCHECARTVEAIKSSDLGIIADIAGYYALEGIALCPDCYQESDKHSQFEDYHANRS